MKLISLHVLFFFVLCTFTTGIGIGISPTSIELKPGEEKTVWLNNPNQHTIPVFIETDCDDVEMESHVFEVDANNALGVVLIAASKTDGCNTSLVISIANENSAGLLPSIQIPLIVLPGTETQDEIPDSPPNFSKAAVILSIVFCLILIYCVDIYLKKRSTKKPIKKQPQ